ncbi:MAG TPA: PASTA domain-containing protein [Gemmatimonadales bacterium]|nr:PASTA domain-containing protein [Gemmatimonadales bacterium]
MRIRRHTGSAAPRDPAPVEEPTAAGESTDVPERSVFRTRKPRHRATVAGRRLLRDLLVLAVIFVVGYVAAAAVLSPVPLLSASHAVPRVLELPAAEAQRKLTAAGFRPKLEEPRAHATVPRGQIVWQDPPPGVVLGQNTPVTLVPSAGPLGVPVPDVVGLATPQAERILHAAGLRVGAVDTIAADPEPGIVIATRPAVGTAREPGGTVGLVISGRPLVGLVNPPRGPRAPAGPVRLVTEKRK